MYFDLNDIQTIEKETKVIIMNKIKVQQSIDKDLDNLIRVYIKTQIRKDKPTSFTLKTDQSCKLYAFCSGVVFLGIPLSKIKCSKNQEIIGIGEDLFFTYIGTDTSLKAYRITKYITSFMEEIEFRIEI